MVSQELSANVALFIGAIAKRLLHAVIQTVWARISLLEKELELAKKAKN
jgi:hypothetical protein